MEQPFGRIDENIASVLFGWCLALLCLTSYRIVQSLCLRGSTKSYVHLALSTFLVLTSAPLAAIAWSYQINRIRAELGEFTAFVILWSIQAQLYFQIILCRILILDWSKKSSRILRIGTFFLILAINASIIAVWLPRPDKPSAKPSIPSIVFFWWPRIEKMLFIMIDLALNVLFIRQIYDKLMRIGLFKYKKLIWYNVFIIVLSLSNDILLLGMQWFPHNNTIYVLVHPVVFLNKLVFEFSICDRMAAISREPAPPLKKVTLRTDVGSISAAYYSDTTIQIAEKCLPSPPSP